MKRWVLRELNGLLVVFENYRAFFLRDAQLFACKPLARNFAKGFHARGDFCVFGA